MKEITVSKLQEAMLSVADEIIKNEPYLTEVDTIIGDGDHGTGMKRGFTALRAMLTQSRFQTADELFKAVGMELVKTMGGASGVIFGTMFIGGLDRIAGLESVGADPLAGFFEDGYAAIQRRGKARAGQKTMLDALIPAAGAMRKAADSGVDADEALRAGYEAACAGVEATKEMQSRVGRSKNFQEASRGLPDPGAISTSLIFKALYMTVCES